MSEEVNPAKGLANLSHLDFFHSMETLIIFYLEIGIVNIINRLMDVMVHFRNPQFNSFLGTP